MKIKKLLFLLTSLALALMLSANAHEKKWPEKRLRQTWPTAEKFTSKQITLSPTQVSQLTGAGLKMKSEDRSPTFFSVLEKAPSADKASVVGIILFIDEAGANGNMEISVAMGSDGQVKKVDIWEHSENASVAKPEFLKLFEGKTAKDSFIAGKDYQVVPGSEKASEAVAHAVEKSLKITNLVFSKK